MRWSSNCTIVSDSAWLVRLLTEERLGNMAQLLVLEQGCEADATMADPSKSYLPVHLVRWSQDDWSTTRTLAGLLLTVRESQHYVSWQVETCLSHVPHPRLGNLTLLDAIHMRVCSINFQLPRRKIILAASHITKSLPATYVSNSLRWTTLLLSCA